MVPCAADWAQDRFDCYKPIDSKKSLNKAISYCRVITKTPGAQQQITSVSKLFNELCSYIIKIQSRHIMDTLHQSRYQARDNSSPLNSRRSSVIVKKKYWRKSPHGILEEKMTGETSNTVQQMLAGCQAKERKLCSIYIYALMERK